MSPSDLPAPPPGKTGWPWTTDSASAPPARAGASDPSAWPSITVITPTFNQGHFIEETIRSILLQGYPRLQYVVIDGGSTDSTLDVLRRYEPWIDSWVSERDRGQTDAINKGLARVRGDIWCFLNSDDLFLPGALLRAASALRDSGARWAVGSCLSGTALASAELARVRAPVEPWQQITREAALFQPSTFYRAECLTRIGKFDETLHFCFDHDYWCRLLVAGLAPVEIDEPLSFYRLHDDSKTCSLLRRFRIEDAEIAARYRGACSPSARAAIDAAVAGWLHHEARQRIIDSFRDRGRAQAWARLVDETVRAPAMLKERPSWGLIRRLLSPQPRFE